MPFILESLGVFGRESFRSSWVLNPERRLSAMGLSLGLELELRNWKQKLVNIIVVFPLYWDTGKLGYWYTYIYVYILRAFYIYSHSYIYIDIYI